MSGDCLLDTAHNGGPTEMCAWVCRATGTVYTWDSDIEIKG
jgi:hypothetical protein